jgi:hypothetical protein
MKRKFQALFSSVRNRRFPAPEARAEISRWFHPKVSTHVRDRIPVVA